MSFDLYFLALEPGESWQDGMDRLEETAADEAQLVDADLLRWQAVLERVRPLLPNGQVFEGERHRQLSDDATGIQLSLSPGELSLTVPYWYDGPDAQQMVGRLRDLASAVEQATGLTAYDPQADAPFINAGERSAASAFDQVHSTFHNGDAPRSASPADGTKKRRGLFRRSR